METKLPYPIHQALTAIPTRLPQRQDALDDQLISLIEMANRAGCYDAADWLKKQMEKPRPTHQIDKDHNEECTGWHLVGNNGERHCMACNPAGLNPAGPPPWHTGPWTTR